MGETPPADSTTPDGRNPVEVLAEEFARRLRGGEYPSIQEYVDRHPDLAGEIRTLFPSIAMMERAAEAPSSSSGATAPLTEGFELTRETVGDFRILREIGRGGMGVVYEAQQQSLNRRVALKVLCPAVSRSPRQLRRFQREAEAAARLHHTNIVPVFGTGEDAGLHFYAMQLIDGVSFGEILAALRSPDAGDWLSAAEDSARAARGEPSPSGFTVGAAAAALLRRTARSRGRLREAGSESAAGECYVTPGAAAAAETPADAPAPPPGPTAEDLLANRGGYFRRVAKIGVSVARALAYSHQQGILHRDIKPSNVLLDRDGIVWVADFGLAKHADHEGVTNPGDIVGTIRYMAPERFSGLADARSDVHSLGLMLYELLTLRPAFQETRHGLLIRQKMSSTPPPPRSVVRHVPRDLETIVLKACAIDPAHRYQRAERLEADLKRFLEGRPIHARRVPSVERLWRWARRNPVTAVLSTSTMLLLLTAAVVFAVGKYGTDRALGLLAVEKARVEQEKARVEAARAKAVAAGEVATRERARAETNLRVAIAAFEQIITNIASRGVPDSYAQAETQPTSAVTPADVQLLETLLTFFDRFATQNSADLQVESAAARRRVGDIQKQIGRLAEAEISYRKAIDAYRAMADSTGRADAFLVERARILNEIARLRSRRGDVREALLVHREARALLEGPGVEPTPAVRFEVARTLVLKASVGLDVRRPGRFRPPGRGPASRPRPGRRPGMVGELMDQQTRDCQRALTLLTSLVDAEPSNPDYRLTLARAHRAHADHLLREDGPRAAEKALQAALTCLEKLTADFPEAAMFRYELADTLRADLADSADRGQRIRRAVTLSTKLLADHPDIPEYQSLAGDCLSELAGLQLRAGDLDDAAASYEQAMTYQKPIADRFPSVLLAQHSYVQSLSGLADVHIRRGHRDAARPLLEEAVRRLESTKSRGGPRSPRLRLLNRLKQQQAKLTGR